MIESLFDSSLVLLIERSLSNSLHSIPSFRNLNRTNKVEVIADTIRFIYLALVYFSVRSVSSSFFSLLFSCLISMFIDPKDYSSYIFNKHVHIAFYVWVLVSLLALFTCTSFTQWQGLSLNEIFSRYKLCLRWAHWSFRFVHLAVRQTVYPAVWISEWSLKRSSKTVSRTMNNDARWLETMIVTCY